MGGASRTLKHVFGVSNALSRFCSPKHRKQRLLEIVAAEGLSFDGQSGKKPVVTQRAFGKSALFIAWATSLIVAVVVTLIISKRYLNQDVGRAPTPSITNRTTVPLPESKPNMPSAAADREDTKELIRLRVIVETQKRQLNEQRRLDAADQSARELLGARNVQWVNIFPRDESGRPTREFGRMIYVEGKGLRLYAFDLNGGTNLKVGNAFYVWGQTPGQPEGATSHIILLGKLTLDKPKDNRWSLAITDPRVLVPLRAVFVTIESGDRVVAEPTGRRTLYAPLNMRPDSPQFP